MPARSGSSRKARRSKKAESAGSSAVAKGGTKKTARRKSARKAVARKTSGRRKGARKKSGGISPERLETYVRAHAESLLADPNITSVGVGYKISAGQRTPVLSIQFTVDDKLSPQELVESSSRPIPKTINVGGSDVPTDVIERSYRPSYTVKATQEKDNRRARADTMCPGMSVGGPATAGGTIGVFAKDRETGRRVLLSNWHVLQGAKGRLGNPVVQPGKHDDNRVDENVIGRVLRSHLGPAGDCAIASVSGRDASNTPIEIPTVVIDSIGKPALHDVVIKSGRTTGVTYGKVTRVGVNARIHYGPDEAGDAISAIVGGFEIGIDPNHAPADGEVTRSGDSGSSWLAVNKQGKPTGIMLGLHFAGDAENTVTETALACYAESVMNKLEIEPLGKVVAEGLGDDSEGLRTGFDPAFLPFKVGVKGFTSTRAKDLARLNGEREIRYCHFSVWLSKSRKYPVCVAWNIDGGRFRTLNRKSFRVDRRGDLETYQLTDAIYKNNPIDRGHLARRADLCWGSKAEAEQGNYDSFYFTNIAPQHEAFNQSGNRDYDDLGGKWGRLENTVFDSENPHDLKVSLVGGPVFGARDATFEQDGERCKIPKQFWKVVSFVDDEDNGRHKVYGFVLSQAGMIRDLLGPEGLDFGEWVWARISLSDLEGKTGVRFVAEMHANEVPIVGAQSLSDGSQIRPILVESSYFRG